jgi:type VI protein secretion system component VasK
LSVDSCKIRSPITNGQSPFTTDNRPMTVPPLIHTVILATADLGRAFQTHNRRTTSARGLLIFTGIVLAVIALVALLAYLDRWRKGRTLTTDAELVLFRSLCRVHGLTAAEINLLSQLAAANQLQRRCDLFIDPSYLASSARRSSENAEDYARLHEAIFGRDPLAA